MTPLDWVVIAAYVAAVLLLGAVLSRRAGSDAESYLVAGRQLRWWVIGISDVAGQAGADAAWIAMVFAGGFMAPFKVFWIGAAVTLPLAVLWARYWRRLALLSPGQIYEERYSGRAAGAFRGVAVVYSSLIANVVILAFVLQLFAQILAPFFPWDPVVVLAVFAGASMLYTMAAGLLGVTYSDVPQFVLIMVGRVTLATIMVSALGGFDAVVDAVEAQRGADFLRAAPPADDVAETWSSYAIDPMSLVALIAMGLINIANAQSASVQRSLAARSELDAALGQALNAVLTLAFRMVPVLLLGFCAIALNLPDTPPMEIWAEMVKQHAGPGLTGLLLVGVIAGSMSTIDTFLNFMTAGLFNDFYRRHLRPTAGVREQVLFCRLATVAVTGIAFLWAYFLIGEIGDAWIQFINRVVMLFILPLTMLRWLWWRLTIQAEIVGFVVAYPLAWAVWFPLGFSEAPYWQAFGLLAGAGWLVILGVTLVTKPEPMPVLEDFYRRVRPPGFWGPVAARSDDDGMGAIRSREVRADLASAAVGVVFCTSLVLGVTATLSRSWGLLAVAGAVAILSGWAWVRALMRGEAVRRSLESAQLEP